MTDINYLEELKHTHETIEGIIHRQIESLKQTQSELFCYNVLIAVDSIKTWALSSLACRGNLLAAKTRDEIEAYNKRIKDVDPFKKLEEALTNFQTLINAMTDKADEAIN